ncbi:30482_t:CDS:1, partial [Racocetra persica]
KVLPILPPIFVKPEVSEELENLGSFNNFEFEDKILKKVKRYLA